MELSIKSCICGYHIPPTIEYCDGRFRVICSNCWANARSANSKEQAITYWNEDIIRASRDGNTYRGLH